LVIFSFPVQNAVIITYAIIFIVTVCIVLQRYLLLTKVSYFKDYFAHGPWGDAITYLYLTQFFRKNKCGVPDQRSLITSEPVYYPSLFMSVVGRLFSDSLLFRYSWLPNFVLYALFVSLYAITLCFLYKGSDLVQIVFILLFFVAQADNINFDKHRMHFIAFQPRFMNACANSFFWILYVFSDPLEHWVPKIVLIVICINTSLFGRQSILFVFILVSAIMADVTLLGYCIAACIVSMVVFRREFLKSWQLQL